MIQETKGRFGFHLIGDEDRRYPLHLNVQFYVKSSALSRSADLAISPHLATDTDIDQFVDEAIAALTSYSGRREACLGRCVRRLTHFGNEPVQDIRPGPQSSGRRAATFLRMRSL